MIAVAPRQMQELSYLVVLLLEDDRYEERFKMLKEASCHFAGSRL